jgi:hypothetical protein
MMQPPLRQLHHQVPSLRCCQPAVVTSRLKGLAVLWQPRVLVAITLCLELAVGWMPCRGHPFTACHTAVTLTIWMARSWVLGQEGRGKTLW